MTNYTSKKLGEIFEIARGGSPRPISKFITEDPDGINWVMIGDGVEGSKYISETKKKIIQDGVKRSRRVKPGDFILSNSMSFGRPYIMETDGCIHDGWLLLRPRTNDISTDYFYYLLGSEAIYQKFKLLAGGSTVKNLNIDLVSNVEVPYPDLSTQQEIAARLDDVSRLKKQYLEGAFLTAELLEAIAADVFKGNI
ncbi:restriction endonuclease subunit S [Maritimibacter fusiformis]|uniref:Restriction endonuclease subunit S n=1 Tax=Maritimibacter fusiformis TaxID=2603819 RepID=A0A5D0RR99_9RHOB|nr:restriction endonuclease subunit S [Maritimibacter fusiformis]TYB83476.1 restriction endonuclease subunit S [Maritimibacter fusiformis]